ncbi:MAG: hypothetical protein M1825_001286 [Sarcosagium campestre]|nr:MAG: hypothetical protein M1825_001286 [Sarcosagium campestre]
MSAAAAASSPQETTLSTLSLLESRLCRLEYAVTGSGPLERANGVAAPPPDQTKIDASSTVAHRVAEMEKSLQRLASRSKPLGDILALHARHPDFFHSPRDPSIPPTQLTTISLRAIVLASAPLYPTTASRLTSIVDTPIPSAESSAALMALAPRLARLELLQERQSRELAELRRRSAVALERHYEISILGIDRCMVEWDERVNVVEAGARRIEKAYAAVAAAAGEEKADADGS